MSVLMDIIHECENRLGWSPPSGAILWKARAAEHRKLTIGMEKYAYDEEDLRLALAYCIRRKQPLASPLELLGFVKVARDLAPAKKTQSGVADDVGTAIIWEQNRSDVESSYWVSRLVRSSGPARTDVLREWRDAGRGDE